MKGMFVRLSVRQLVYMGLIVALLLPLSMLSQPATGDRQTASGGQLARLRSQYKLGDANIGAIDPRSETIRLVSLGLGGIANLILWGQADEYKEKEDWTSYRAVLDNLINLQPYYPVVWEHQAWNLSYNISAEFDDYRDKYYWVMDGIRFLQRGSTYLEDNPRLLARTGWFTTHKIGRSDEKVSYRRLFREDDDFHRNQRVQERDNWLFGREYYRIACNVIDSGKARLGFMEPVIFHSEPIRAEMFSGDALVSDHELAIEAVANQSGDSPQRRAQFAEIDKSYQQQIRGRWNVAEGELREFGNRPFAAVEGTVYRLGELDAKRKLTKELMEKLDAIEPGLRKKLREEHYSKLTDIEKESLKVDVKVRSEEQQRHADSAEEKLFVSDEEIVEHVDPSRRSEAEAIAKQLHEQLELLFKIEQGRKLIAYDYWLPRCELEQTDDARLAYQHFAHGSAAYKIDTDLTRARNEYETGFAMWRKILDKYPQMLNDQTAYIILDEVKTYRAVLDQLDEKFPEKFILADLIKAND